MRVYSMYARYARSRIHLLHYNVSLRSVAGRRARLFHGSEHHKRVTQEEIPLHKKQ